jgi:hypothetical protein
VCTQGSKPSEYKNSEEVATKIPLEEGFGVFEGRMDKIHSREEDIFTTVRL